MASAKAPDAFAIDLPAPPDKYSVLDQRQLRDRLAQAIRWLGSRPALARPWIYASEYGVTGDGTDEQSKLQAALDAGLAQQRIVYGGSMAITIGSALTMSGPGLVFDDVSHGDAGGPGIVVTGSGYTALTVEGSPQLISAAVYGTGNACHGVYFNNPSRAVVPHIRVYNLNGFGVQIDKCYDCFFGAISVESCGNASNYAFSMNPAGDTSNMTHVLRLQVEKANAKAIWIDDTTLSCVVDNIHSEQATPSAGVETWHLSGGVQYNSLRLASLAPAANATAHLANSVFIQPRIEGDIVIELEGSSGGNITLVRPDFSTGVCKALTNQTGVITVLGGAIPTLNSDGNVWRVHGTQITTLTVGFCNSDATRMQFYGCPIGTLVSNSTTAAATFHSCTISEGNSLLRGQTVFRGGSVTCAGTIAHSSGTLEVHDATINAAISYTNAAPIRGYGAIFNGGITRGDAGSTNIVCDDACVSIGATSNVGVPTAGAHTVGERHKNLVPATGADFGWICTVAGTPGTWVALGSSASSVAHTLNVGTHLSIGAPFDGSANQTITTDATNANTASTIMARDANGDFSSRIANLRDCVLSGDLNLGNNFVAGAPAATGYVTIKDLGGTVYKVLVAP